LRLKNFKLHGFKSFADTTTLKFDGDVVAIVGPNGCGKSNIADAIRWVTGEKSAKSMRSPSMADVIFSGTQTRKPLNFAEVTLMLSDVEEDLPTEYDEVAITRRLHRSGESQYLINGNTVRLKDIEDLLSGTGIGRNAISIFEQGKIDQVIYLNPEERRSIIEEVAGISRFITRKKETLRNLKKTEDNIARVYDILSEVEKQMKTAERQAEKAVVYREKKERLESLDKSLLVTKWRQYGEEGACLRKQFQGAEAELEQAAKDLALQEQQLHQLKTVLEEREQVLRNKSETLYEAKSKKELQQQTIRVNHEKLQQAEESQERLIRELSDLKQKKSSYEEEIDRLKAQKDTFDTELRQQEAELNAEKEKTEKIEAEVAVLRSRHQNAQNERLEYVQIENHSEADWKQTKLKLDHFYERRDQGKVRLSGLGADIEGLETALEKKRQEMRRASEAVDKQKKALEQLDDQAVKCERSLKQAQSDLDKLQRGLTENEARKKVLVRLKEEMQGFSTATKKLMKESKSSGSPLHNRLQGLYELLVLDAEAQEPLSVALRPYNQTLVVKTKQEFNLVLEYARKHGLKDFSILCLEHVNLPLTKELIHHFLQKIQVVSNPEEVFAQGELQDFEYCTKDNAYIDRHKVVFYPGKEENNAFLREAELKTLKSDMAAVEKDKKNLEGSLENIQKEHQDLQRRKIETDKALRKDEMTLVEVNFSLQRASADLEKAKKEKHDLEAELQSLETTISDLKKKLDDLSRKYEEVKQKARQTLEANSQTESELAALSESLAARQRVLKEKELAYKHLYEKNQEMAYQLNLLTHKRQQAGEEEGKIEKELQKLDRMRQELGGEDEKSADKLEEADKTLQRFAEAVKEEENTVREHKLRIEKVESDTARRRSIEKELIEKKNQWEVKLSQISSHCESLEHELDERYQLSMDDEQLSEIERIEILSEAEKELKSLRQSIERIGPVNMEAIEEKEQHAERYSYLSKQVEDLEESKNELLAIISELEKESRKLYEETFAEVRENFKKNFEILFRGGEADLRLTGSEDVLEAGVEITAKPPGKQMRSITLLSGGEKCLTALAFLFAIFEVKPAPFCILDEIDAPLDDSNIQRFVEVLKQFTDKCQFIIVTHNKRTMSIADTLYGVTMEEKGVSKLLSLEFQKGQAFSEPDLVEA
jgi:chromosome segregation protein